MDDDLAAEFMYQIMKTLDMDGYVSFSVAKTCSKVGRDAFGGAAFFITKNGVEHIDTNNWLSEKESAYCQW